MSSDLLYRLGAVGIAVLAIPNQPMEIVISLRFFMPSNVGAIFMQSLFVFKIWMKKLVY
jgi:hypothetical protein